METKSQALLKAAKEECLFVRLLQPDGGESNRILALLDSLYFGDSPPYGLNGSECRWTSYAEQTACFGKLVLFLAHPFEAKRSRIFFVPMFGPDEILEVSAESLFALIDSFLDFDWFVICCDDAVPAIVQRRYGVMELFLPNSG